MWMHHLVFILSSGVVFTFCDIIKANELLPNRGILERYEVSAAAAERSNETLACYERLRKTAHFAAHPVISEPAECAVHDLVQLDRIIMEDGSEVSFSSAPILRCGMAEAVTEWIRNDVGALATELGAPLRMIASFDSYQCRSRNRVSGAQPSEHGKGNALDVGAITLRNGATFSFVDSQVARAFREQMRTAACHRFTTVLGPGADAFHNDHVHLDLKARSRGHRICQWAVLDRDSISVAVPLPLPKPAGWPGTCRSHKRNNLWEL